MEENGARELYFILKRIDFPLFIYMDSIIYLPLSFTEYI